MTVFRGNAKWNNKTSSTTLSMDMSTFTGTAILPSDLLVMLVSVDNLTLTTPTVNVTGTQWTVRQTGAPGAITAAAGGVISHVLTRAGVNWRTGDANTALGPFPVLSGAVAAKIATLIVINGAATTTITLGTNNTANAAATNANVFNSASIAAGRPVIGWISSEAASVAVPTSTTFTTLGSAQNASTGGSAATNAAHAVMYGVLPATSSAVQMAFVTKTDGTASAISFASATEVTPDWAWAIYEGGIEIPLTATVYENGGITTGVKPDSST